MNTRRIIWLSCTLFVILLFYALIPVDVYEAHTMLFSFLGGALFFVTAGQTIADFESIYDLTEKPEPGTPEPAGRKLFPFMIIPGIIFVFILVFHQSNRKEKELKKYGKLTKGTVVNGSSTTTTRRFRSNTSYDLILSYSDSTGRKHNFEQSVSSSEFGDAYKGQQVDLVYSKIHPDLAKALLSLQELGEYTPVANNKISIGHLIAILESNEPDTIINFLNQISYQWTKNEDVYANEKRDLAIKILMPRMELAYIERESFVIDERGDSFEGSLASKGFKKKSTTVGDKTEEIYYNDKWKVSKERKMSDSEQGIGMSFYMIYHVYLNLDAENILHLDDKKN